jgi:cobaltochelatase CobN
MKIRSNQLLSGAIPVLFFVALLGYSFWTSYAKPTAQKTIVFVIGNNQAEALIRGVDLFYRQYPELAQTVEVIVRTRSNTNAETPLPPCDMLVVKVMEVPFFEQHLPAIQAANKPFTPKGLPMVRLAMGHPGTKYTEEDYEQFGMKRDPQVEAYYDNGSPEDWKKMIAYLLHRYANFTNLAIEPTQEMLTDGLVVIKNGRVAELVATWEEWLQKQQPDTSKDKVAILAYSSNAQEGIMHIETAIAAEIERQGMQPVIVFGYPGSKAIPLTILDTLTGKSRVQACISQFFKFADKKAVEVLRQLDVPLINSIDLYGPSMREWQQSRKGLSSTEVAWQIAIPELSGLVQPTVVGGVEMKSDIPYKVPIPERVERIVARAKRYIHLQKTPPNQRKVAVLYWNYPPGKENIGASYLNVMRSLHQLMLSFQQAGYTVNGFDPAKPKVLEQMIQERGRNIGRYAAGELQTMASKHNLITVSVEEYKQWFGQLPKKYQAEINNHWGAPDQADIMTIRKNGTLHFVLPVLQMGNIYLLVQPDRARSQDIAALYHSQTLPPHHQYLCAYLWLQRNMDAIVHTGTHGTQEWLEGKETGLSNTDSPEVMAGDLPIMYIYNMDVVGEGLQAKRRGAATIIDHLTPALGEAGLSPEMKQLNDLIRQWDATRAVNPEGAVVYLDKIDAQAKRMGIHKDLEKEGWQQSLKGQPEEQSRKMIEALQHYIEESREQSTPFGLHTFGVAPAGARLDEFAAMIAKVNGAGRKSEFRQALARAGAEELRMLHQGLSGRYVLPESGNDPIRSPSAIPTGRNFYTFDPRTVPVPYADSIGRQMANQLVADFYEQHKRYPEKFTFEIWSNETIRHQGMQEAQVMALLGVRIKRDKMGRVEDLELIPRAELGRPRVDVVVSTTGLYRDNFPMFIELLDKAIRLAASSPEPDNPIRRNSEKLRQQLIASGMDSTLARTRSLIRIFAEPSGTYSSKISEATYASGSWDEDKQVAELYIRRMGNGYGGGIWGESMETEFKAALSGTEGIVHSRSSSLYMTLDNDDFFGFAGAIALGVRYVDNTDKSPPMLVADLRVRGAEKYTPIERFMGQELRTRYFNPEYIKAMTQEGYAGARHIMNGVDWMWGWQVVYPEVINAEKWQEFYEVWLKDRYDLKTDEFFEENSPHAKEAIAARMLEAVRKNYWQPSKEVSDDLAKIYVETVAKHGVACGHTTCDHPELQEFIKGIALNNPAIAKESISKWLQNVEKATGKPLAEALAQRKAEKADWKDPSKIKSFNPNQPTREAARASAEGKQTVQGYRMEEEQVINAEEASAATTPSGDPSLLIGLLAAQILCFLVGIWWQARGVALQKTKESVG